jgi:hypothetical protein
MEEANRCCNPLARQESQGRVNRKNPTIAATHRVGALQKRERLVNILKICYERGTFHGARQPDVKNVNNNNNKKIIITNK